MATANYEKGNFLTVPNKHIVLKLRGAIQNIYLVLVDHANNKGQCWPSYGRISKECGFGRRQCIRAMNELESMGLIKKTGRTRDDGGQTSNVYQLMLIHIPGDRADTPPSDRADTPGSDSAVTPELKQVNYNHKELLDRKFKKSYAKACAADKIQQQKATQASNRSGSFSSIREIALWR